MDAKNDNSKDFKDYIGLMEQLLTTLNSLYSSDLSAKLFGQDTFSLEYISYKNQLHFHLVIPEKYRSLFEKMTTSFFSDAVIEETDEINIFEGEDLHYTTKCLILNKDYIYPIKTYQKLESDPINNITNALTKLDEDEACMIQIVLSPTSSNWQNLASKAANQKQNKTESFSFSPLSLLKEFINFWKTEDKDKKEEKSDSPSSLESEEIKLIDEKNKKI